MTGNGRVTTAELGRKIDNLANKVDKFCDQAEPRLREVERIQSVQTNRLDCNKEEIDLLRKSSNRWDGIIGAGTIIGSIFATIIGTNK